MKDYTDLPREELLLRAQAILKMMPDSELHFKFTCEKCGARVMLSDANILYERGECCECGHSNEIKKGGFTLIQKFQ